MRAAIIREARWTGPGPPRPRARSRSSRSQRRPITPTPSVLPGHRTRVDRARGPIARTDRSRHSLRSVPARWRTRNGASPSRRSLASCSATRACAFPIPPSFPRRTLARSSVLREAADSERPFESRPAGTLRTHRSGQAVLVVYPRGDCAHCTVVPVQPSRQERRREPHGSRAPMGFVHCFPSRFMDSVHSFPH